MSTKFDNQEPFLTVVIPTYNQARKLLRCLKSVLNQDFRDMEVIVIDDGSVDNSGQLVRQVTKHDKRVKILYQSNSGAGVARNLGLKNAKGHFVHFVDSDDWLEQGIYTALFNQVQKNPSIDLLMFEYVEHSHLSDNKRLVGLFGLAENETRHTDLCDENYLLLRTSVVPWNKLIRLNYLQEIEAQFDNVRYANDRTFHFRVVTGTANILLCGLIGINHEVNRFSSLSSRHGLPRLRATLQSFLETSRLVGGLSEKACEIIFDVNMKNLVWEYSRTRSDQKISVAKAILSWLNSEHLPFDPTQFRSASWYPVFNVIRSVSQLSDLKKKVIPVVMATNEAYFPYLLVTLHSISHNLASDVICVVYVFHLGLPADLVTQIEDNLGYSNIRVFCISFVHISGLECLFNRGHYSAEMYLRLWIPELLDVYPKVLYLDCDLLVQRDLGELFDIDVSYYDMAGVRDFNNEQHRKYIEQDLGLTSDAYINSGVLLLNTHRLCTGNFRDRCLEALKRHPILNCPDQDMINIACAGKILLLDPGWNYLWQYGFSRYRPPPDGNVWYVDDFENSRAKRYIIHYSSAIKPWLYPHLEQADLFWAVARETKCFKIILRDASKFKVAESQKQILAMRQRQD